MEKTTFNLKSAANFLGVTEVTLYKAIRLGQIPVVLIGERRRIVKADLEAFLQRKLSPSRLNEPRGRFAKTPEGATTE